MKQAWAEPGSGCVGGAGGGRSFIFTNCASD